VSTTQLEELLATQPDAIREEILDINTDAGHRALQVALLVPIVACLLGFANSFRLMRLPYVPLRKLPKGSCWVDTRPRRGVTGMGSTSRREWSSPPPVREGSPALR
jgi:hypothetical protein